MADNATREEPRKEGASKLLLIVTGIMVPVLALALPYLVEFFSPKAALAFETQGPIQVKGAKAFSVVIRNDGKTVEKTVELWLPGKLEPTKFKLDSNVSVSTRSEQSATVIVVGDLRPNEKARISILVDDPVFFVHEYTMKDLRIVSLEHLGVYLGRSDEWDFIYRTGFWAFVVLLFLAVVLGVYQQNFMSREEREKMILKEMEKLK